MVNTTLLQSIFAHPSCYWGLLHTVGLSPLIIKHECTIQVYGKKNKNKNLFFAYPKMDAIQLKSSESAGISLYYKGCICIGGGSIIKTIPWGSINRRSPSSKSCLEDSSLWAVLMKLGVGSTGTDFPTRAKLAHSEREFVRNVLSGEPQSVRLSSPLVSR